MRRAGVLVALAALLVAAGCSLFCPGPSDCISNGAVVVKVVDAETKAPIVDATVLASSGSASATEVANCPYDFAQGGADAGPSNCRAIQSPGKYHVVVRAPGYIDAALDVEAEKDVCGDLKSQVREVGLQKLGTVVQPVVNASEACGG